MAIVWYIDEISVYFSFFTSVLSIKRNNVIKKEIVEFK